MFYCYVLRSQKTGRRYVGSCENLAVRLRRHNAGDSKATRHGVRGCYSLVKHLGLARKLQSASSTSRPEEAGESSTSCWQSGRHGDRPWVQIPPARCESSINGNILSSGTTVAAATGRGFKSHQSD